MVRTVTQDVSRGWGWENACLVNASGFEIRFGFLRCIVGDGCFDLVEKFHLGRRAFITASRILKMFMGCRKFDHQFPGMIRG